MEWKAKESEGSELEELTELFRTRKAKTCADIARCAVCSASAESEEYADHSNPISEKGLAFPGLIIAILVGGVDEAGVDAARSVLALCARSLHGGPLCAYLGFVVCVCDGYPVTDGYTHKRRQR